MSVLEKLASSLGRRDEKPNQALAALLIKAKDKKAIKELVENLDNKDKDIQSDCIKVLYEIGEKEPELIAPYGKEFLSLLGHKNNRLAWGAMTALDGIAEYNQQGIYKNLGRILDIAKNGSVITKDHAVGILIKLAKVKAYHDNCMELLLAEFKTALTNQLPKYAEDTLPVMSDKYKKNFAEVLTSRLKDIEKDTKRARVEKVIKKLA
jgi:hypothetical protein